VHIANGQFRVRFRAKTPSMAVNSDLKANRAREGYRLLTIAALHQENYATIPNYLET
jgi:hypothetical protein